jgi:pyridoxal phosphate enzyme (YggS family)
MVHSVDSLRLLEALDAASAEAGVALPVLLEVNVSGESSKFGLRPDDVPALLEQSGRLRQVEIRGLMTIPPFQPEPEGARPFFRKLRELRDRWRDQCGMDLAELSMGMSDDFEVAVEEGATMVRVGTALFGKRKARVSSVEGRGASDE